MKFELIISDIDGTLVNRRQELLTETETIIRSLVHTGVRFATASARTRTNTFRIIALIKDLCSAFAYINGAFIETGKGEILRDQPLAETDISNILACAESYQASLCLMSVDDATAIIHHDECLRAFRLIHNECRVADKPTIPQARVYGIMIYSDTIHAIAAQVGQFGCHLEAGPVTHITGYGGGYMFIGSFEFRVG